MSKIVNKGKMKKERIIMSGPALKHVDSHSAIHEAALNEAVELTNLLDQLVQNKKLDKAQELAWVVVEQWETRTLRHAESEEKGLYKELVEEKPELEEAVIGLTRDHDLLRLVLGDIKDDLAKSVMNDKIVQQFQALIFINEKHNEKEMEILPDH